MLVPVTLGVAVVLLAVDLYAFGRMTRTLRRSHPAVYEEYFASGTWMKYFDEGDATIWAFYKSDAGNDDPEIQQLKAFSKAMSWIAPAAWLVFIGSLYLR